MNLSDIVSHCLVSLKHHSSFKKLIWKQRTCWGFSMGVSLTDYKVLRVFDHDTYCNYLSCLALCDPHHLLLSFDSLTMHCRHGSIAFLHIGFCATHLRSIFSCVLGGIRSVSWISTTLLLTCTSHYPPSVLSFHLPRHICCNKEEQTISYWITDNSALPLWLVRDPYDVLLCSIWTGVKLMHT